MARCDRRDGDGTAMSTAMQAALLALIAVPLAAATARWHPRRPEWSAAAPAADEIEVAAAVRLDAALWVDARPAERFAADHVPGAIPLDERSYDQGFARFAEAWDPGRPVVVYCDGGGCDASRHLAERLRADTGSADIHVLHGGWPAWLDFARR
jgi:rhodanese-related sulfurtransferase